MKRIQIDPDVQQFLLSRGVDLGESASTILRRELHLESPPGTVEIDDDVYAFLVSRMQAIGESASTILRRELHLAAGPGPAPAPAPAPGPAPEPGHGPTVVEFHIPAGTSSRPWNTREGTIVASVGDTLRIVNDDLVPHRPHTPGIPFPHPAADIEPGQSADFVLAAPFDPAVNGALSDHLFGPAASFFLDVRARQ